MEFNNIVIIIALILLIGFLIMYGLLYSGRSITGSEIQGYPYTQDECPKLWVKDGNGNCLNPSCSFADTTLCNSLAGQDWKNQNKTPGYNNALQPNGGFNPNDSKWASYKSAKSDICGKKIWSQENRIDWNGVSTYNPC